MWWALVYHFHEVSYLKHPVSVQSGSRYHFFLFNSPCLSFYHTSGKSKSQLPAFRSKFEQPNFFAGSHLNALSFNSQHFFWMSCGQEELAKLNVELVSLLCFHLLSWRRVKTSTFFVELCHNAGHLYTVGQPASPAPVSLITCDQSAWR